MQHDFEGVEVDRYLRLGVVVDLCELGRLPIGLQVVDGDESLMTFLAHGRIHQVDQRTIAKRWTNTPTRK